MASTHPPAEPDARSAARDRRVLSAVCFLSGAAALVFEMAWFHRSGLVFGNSVWATSTVLSSFMGGLALGNALVAALGHRLRQFLRAYAGVELVVAASGVALTYALPGVTEAVVAVTAPAAGSPWLAAVIRVAVAFTLLLVPATAMGATLPLLVAALTRGRTGFGPALGRLYGWNTLGAVAGVVGAEVLLVGWVGVAGAAWVAGLLGAGAAAVAWRLSRPEPPLANGTPTSATPPRVSAGVAPAGLPLPGRGWPLLACAFLSGGTLLALEVVWFRFLSMYVLSTTLAVSVMLAMVLAAIGLGGLLASAWLGRSPAASLHAPAVAWAGGGAVVAAYAAFDLLTAGTQIAATTYVAWLAAVLTVPASLLSGVLFTLLGDALQRVVAVETRAAGWLTLANTAGAMLGPLIAAFALLPRFGMEGAFFVLAVTYAVVGLMALAGVGSWRTAARSPAAAGGGGLLVIALVGFPFGQMRDVHFARVAAPYAVDGAAIVATREGPSETIFLMRQSWRDTPVYHRLVTNGFSMSGTTVPAQRYMRYFVYWPMALYPGPLERVLVICYGVGTTADAALDLPDVVTVDVVEISPDVVAVSDHIYPTRHPLRDPRVRLHLDDGRQFLQTTTTRYDLITGEPPPPRTPGAASIYTREYFQLIHDRLAEGGITTYWLPVGRPDPGTNVTAIIGAFCDVFDDCSLWNATPFDLMLVGTRGAAAPASVAAFARSWGDPTLRARLEAIGLELPQQVGATFLGDAAYLRALVGDAPPLVDNYPRRLRPRIDHPSLSDPVSPAVTALLESVLDPVRARAAFAASTLIARLWPPELHEATLPYFAHQRVLNRVLWDGSQPLAQIEDLHWLLTETPLQTLPLWILGSDDVRQRIALEGARRPRAAAPSGGDDAGATDYARGLQALVRRDYVGAASALADAEERGLRGDAIRPLRVYALCLAGRLDEARRLARGVGAPDAAARHFWDWLRATFDVALVT